MLAEFRQQRFPGDREFRAALDRYGVTEEQLKAHLLWQLTALRFTDYRFRSGVPPPGEGLRRHLEEESKDRAKIDAAQPPPARNGHANSQSNGRAPETREQKPETHPGEPEPGERALPHSVDQQMERWLEQARLRTRIRFHEEAFR
jgi:hypothetical protein